MSYVAAGVGLGIALTVLLGLSFYAGRQSNGEFSQHAMLNGIPSDRMHPDLLRATATHGGSNMAVCTGPVDENAEGFFALDFVTGDLKGWVYYPKQGAFGGLFMTNVQGQFGQSKNPEYLLVTGTAAPTATGGNIRPASSLIYVVDMRSGLFAAYAIPWDRTRESSSVAQMGQFVFVAGAQIREPMSGIKKPVVPPAGAAVKKPADPNNPDPNVNPNNPPNNNPGQPGNNNKGKK